MSRNLLRLIAFFLIFLLFLSRVNRALALLPLADEFPSLPIDTSMWHIDLNGGNAGVEDGSLLLSASPGSTYPYLYLKNGPEYLSGDFVFETRFKFYGFQNYGYGIVLADKLLSNGVPNPLGLSDFIFAIWPLGESTHSFSLTTILCSSSSTTCNDYSLATTASWDSWHILRIIRSGQIYFAYLDGDFIFESKPTTKIISQLWLGNPQHTGGIIWGNLLVDYIKINVLTPTPTPTPTPSPTPTPEALRPVVVLPGLGGSWDFGAILNGTAGTNWTVPSFITLYDNLTNSLINAGYEKDKNLFVFGYDWRKGLNDLSGDLNNYVNGLVSQGKIGATDKIDFIGHSFGGLVARTYGQKIGTDKINKIITAGSPHRGNIDAYGLWEGATVWKNVWWQRAALELMIKLNQKSGENRVAVVRRLAPGTKDVLPTFDFLKKSDTLLFSNSLLQKNLTLNDLNSNSATIAGVLWANGGNNNQTDRFLKVLDRDWLAKTQGQWEDGKPIESPFETSNEGDGAVLTLSSTNAFGQQALLTANHEQIISSKDALEKIFEELGLDKTKVVTSVTPDSRKSVYIASLRSPGTLHVCDETNVCDGALGIYLADQKLFFFPGYDEQALTTTVEADGEIGQYQLYLGDMDEDETNWKEERGNLISSNQIDTYPGDSQTSGRSFDEDLSILDGLIPNWDKKNLMAVARSESQPQSKRIVAIRQLRELLSSLAIKAYKNNRTDQIEAIIDVWEDIDNLAETVIGNGNSTKTAFLNANILQVEAYKTLVNNLLKNSSSYYAGTFYTLFTDRFAQAKELKTTKRDISLDKTLSARYLLLTALGVR